MKSTLKNNLLRHLLAKKEEGGFTLIELLVVIIIIGILSAIALPSFLNQANKARQSEAKTYVGSMNRAQQAHYLEQNEWADTLGDLELGVATETETYSYSVDLDANESYGANKGEPWDRDNSQFNGSASVLGYVGAFGTGQTASGEFTTLAELCESATAPVGGLVTGSFDVTSSVSWDATSGPSCTGGFSNVN